MSSNASLGLSALILLLGFYRIVAAAEGEVTHPSAGICSLSVAPHGYTCQEFEVQTADGYILSIQRIPRGRDGVERRDKPPVVIQHGVLVDGTTWFLNPPEADLPLILSDNGFDVWIANTRGTRFCRRHALLDSADPAFWDWSWDELVAYDLPAVFEFVFNETGQNINYVGHSMGTLMLLASLSEGGLAGKLRSAALLCPVAYLSHMTTALGLLSAKSFVGEMVTNILGVAEFNPKDQAVTHYLHSLCTNPGIDCYDLLNSLTGNTCPLLETPSISYVRSMLQSGHNCCLNASTVELFLKNEPQSTSTKNMVHLAQTVRDGVLTKYNYGNDAFNTMHYGKAVPPAYNLSNIPADVPFFLSYGGRDSLSDARDVERLLDALKLHDEGKLTVQFVQDYAHADFIMGVTAKHVVYNAMLSFFRRH